jgi:hypothetical protein
MSKLTPEERAALRASGIFGNRPESLCEDCGGYHLRKCPRIRSQEWLGNGNRVKVEYWESWDESSTIFTEDVFDDSDGEPDE